MIVSHELIIGNYKNMNNGILYIVATPIGNLEDITLRALRILKEVDVVACEDTRVTKKLLNHYSIEKQMVSLHHHSKEAHYERIIGFLQEGKHVAYCADAGTPGVSDPGNQLVALATRQEISVIPIPGVSALATMISVSGIDMQQFCFLGFPPHKKGRETFFTKVAALENPVVYYDSVHRIMKNIELIGNIAPEKKIIVGRELTKLFEEIVRGSALDVQTYFREHPEKVRGEFAIIVYA